MRSNILALQQREADLGKAAKRILTEAEKEGRDLTQAEKETYNKTVAALEANKREIFKEQARLAELDSGIAMPDENAAWAALSRGEAPPENPYAIQKPKLGPKTYRQLFGKANLSNDGFRSFNEFLKAWHFSGQYFDPRLRASQREDTFSTGGAMVPEEFAAALIDKAAFAEVVRPRATVWPCASETRKVPAFDNFDQSDGSFYGFTAQWVPESGPITEQTTKTRLIELHMNKLALLGRCSSELLQDATDFETIFGSAMIAALSHFHDVAYLTGDGAAKPRGILNDPALIVCPKYTGDSGAQDAGTFIFQNAAAMMGKLHPSCFGNAVWVVSPSVIPQLLSMTFNSLSAVDGLRSPAVQQGPDGRLTLFTREVVPCDKLPQLGSQGDVLLADISQYCLGVRPGLGLEKSIHAAFSTDEILFRLKERIDGQGTWKSAIKTKNGETLSWCVVLADRA